MIQNDTIKEAIQRFNKTLTEPIKLKCIFFDMDGVLFDSMPYHAKSWIQTFAEYGLGLPEHEPYMNEGSTALYTIDKMFRKYKNEIVSPEIAKAIKNRKHTIMGSMPQAKVFEYMPQFVERIKTLGIERWVVTGSAQEGLIGRLNAAYNKNFERHKMVTAHDVHNGKPHPEPYLQAIQKSGFNKQQALVIENAPLGVESAKAAGLFTIALNTGPINPQVLTDAGADIVFSNCKSLIDFWPVIAKYL
jgi:HAD superfamily hydrolase (TIGR01509 family)